MGWQKLIEKTEKPIIQKKLESGILQSYFHIIKPLLYKIKPIKIKGFKLIKWNISRHQNTKEDYTIYYKYEKK